MRQCLANLRLWNAAVVVAVVGAIAGCSAPRTPYACAIKLEATAVDVQEVWNCNREIIVRIVKGKKFTLREFERASLFFESLTGVPPDTRVGSDGKLPGPELDQDLAQWDAWYEENGARLVWDPEQRVVTVSPDRASTDAYGGQSSTN